MSLLDKFMDVNKDFFARGEKAIEEKVGPKVAAERATCCGNCHENIVRPPHVCQLTNSIILNPFVKLKNCPYAEEPRG